MRGEINEVSGMMGDIKRDSADRGWKEG